MAPKNSLRKMRFELTGHVEHEALAKSVHRLSRTFCSERSAPDILLIRHPSDLKAPTGAAGSSKGLAS